MNKRQIFVFIHLFFCTLMLEGQEIKRGNNWAMGFVPVIIFNFNSGFTIDTLQQVDALNSASCISDTNGQLLFFSGGCTLIDKDGFLMQNGDRVNCPKGTVLADYYGGGSLFTQTSIVLPKKGNTYYVFSTGMSDSAATLYLNHIDTKFDILNYSIVDMDSNSGKGKVVQKNSILADHQAYANCAMSAVKHGNGKDWWLVKADCYHNRFQVYLVGSDTITGPYYQYSTDTSVHCNTLGQLYFSNNGDKMCTSVYYGKYYDSSLISYLPSSTMHTNVDGITYLPHRVDIYDFDRCTGILTYKNFYVTPFDTSSYPTWDKLAGISFSPDGNLVYMSNMYSIYQVDITDTNKSNGIFVHGPDTTITQFPWYNEMACGPDGKIYIGTFSGSPYMSYIDQPNVKGLGCNFIPHGIWQPYTGLQDPPNMPNYGLGKASVGGTCWPEGVDEIESNEEGELQAFPNPAHNQITVLLNSNKSVSQELILFNTIGQELMKLTIKSNQEIKLDISQLRNGIYYLKVGRRVKKIVVQ